MVQQLIDEELAIEDVVQSYAAGGGRLVEQLEEKISQDKLLILNTLDEEKTSLKASLGRSCLALTDKIKRIQATRVGEIRKQWESDHTEIDSLLMEAMSGYVV